MRVVGGDREIPAIAHRTEARVRVVGIGFVVRTGRLEDNNFQLESDSSNRRGRRGSEGSGGGTKSVQGQRD